MKATRDALVRGSLRTMLVGTVACQALVAVLPIGLSAWAGLPFTVLLTGAVLVATWSPRAAGAGVLVLAVPLLGAMAMVSGGPSSLESTYAPLVALCAWAWFGWRWGIAASAVFVGFLVAGTRYPAPPVTEAQRQLVYVSTTLVGAGIAASVMSALRRSAELASARFADAERAERNAREADEARDRLLAAVNRQLRTPLDSILGHTALLLEEADGDRREDLVRIAAAGRQLRGLVDDLLVAGTQEMEIALGPVDVGALVEEVVSTTAPMAAANKNRVVAVAPRGRTWIESDGARVRQILLNLVSNANKYTTAGEIHIEVSRVGAGVRCVVRDTGVGIPPEKFHLLFQPFAQLHDGLERRPGVGLGLALSQRLAVRLGGSIEASSTPGAGSTFTLALPLAAPSSSAPGGPPRARTHSLVTGTESTAG